MIVSALRVTLGGGGTTRAPAAGRGTENLAAYDDYLRGLYFFQRRGASIPKAVESFTAAIAKDSSFAMLLEAQRRGHRLRYVRPGGLAVAGSRAVATAAALAVRDQAKAHFELGDWSPLEFGPGQVVLMRKDPPVDDQYLYDTHVLGIAQQAGALIVNDPQGLRDYNEKLAALLFPQC